MQRADSGLLAVPRSLPRQASVQRTLSKLTCLFSLCLPPSCCPARRPEVRGAVPGLLGFPGVQADEGECCAQDLLATAEQGGGIVRVRGF